MSDVPRFDCFDDGMREGYNESWVRSSDYDALRAERDALAKGNAALRALLVEALPHIHGNVAEWRMLLNRPGMSPDAYAIANERINSGDALLDRIDAAVQEVKA